MSLQRPAYLANRTQSVLADALRGGLGTSQPPRISLKDDRFTCVMANGQVHPQIKPSLTLDVIIVGGNPHASRIFYDAAYSADEAVSPACWSDNGVGPSENAPSPQSELCGNCPQAVWGSKISPNGNKIPACSTIKKVAVLVPGGQDTVFLLSIPPASLKPWRNFLAHLDTLGAGIDEVIVRLAMADKTLSFEPVDFPPQQVYDFAQKIMQSPEPDVVVGTKDRPRGGALPAPAVKLALAAPAAGFGPAVVEQTERGETDAEREAREFVEFRAARAAGAAKTVEPVAEPIRRTRGPNKPKETTVGPGPIAAGTFAQPTNGFLGAGASPAPASPTASFGVVQATPAGSAIEDALSKAFGLPLGPS